MRTRWLFSWVCAQIALTLFSTLPARAVVVSQIEFIGETRLAAGLIVADTPVGGLSALTYDVARDLFYVVSDDPSGRAPARFYVLKLDLSRGTLKDGDAEIVGMTVIEDPAGDPMPESSLDPEGIAVLDDGSLFISSEGQIRDQVPPFIRRFSLDGTFQSEVSLPPYYSPTVDQSAGPRHNLGLESLTLTPDQKYLYAATENALYQDGPEAGWQVGSPSRVLKFSTANGELVAEYVYPTEPLAAESAVGGGIEVNGLVELLALDEHQLLAMERSFSMGVGNTIRLFQIDVRQATDVSQYPALTAVDPDRIRPVAKRLLLDLQELDLYLDNLEGMTLGPRLPDGRRSLILIADNNFNPLVQVSQILAFAIDDAPVTVEIVQGAAHRSPLEDRWVVGVMGVVTGIRPGADGGFWIEDLAEDGDLATSRGLLVVESGVIQAVAVGEVVEITGRVSERQRRPGELSTTTLGATQIRIATEQPGLRPAIQIGSGGREMPTEVVEDDGLVHFEPRFDGLDFWESLEGMRILVPSPVVIGPTNRYGDLAIAVGSWRPAEARSLAGGLLLRPGDFNPERLIVSFEGAPGPPAASVGDRFDGNLQGIVVYAHGGYRLLAQTPIPALELSGRVAESSNLGRSADSLTVASFNVHNLGARSEDLRFRSVAHHLVSNLGSPDIVALQEIQDDSGPEDDGTVSAEKTFALLLTAVRAAGGPAYAYRQIDPDDDTDGGYPGANIRVAFLFNPERVGFQDRGNAGSWDPARLQSSGPSARLAANPARLQPHAAAFAGQSDRGFSPSRKPLVGEFVFGDQTLFLINLHLASKSGDTRIFGETQPPLRHSEDQRSQQARLVAKFVGSILRDDPAANVLVLGDFNEHEFRSPLRIFGHVPLVNLVDLLPSEDRYTYVFNGNSQMLDHILVSKPLQAKADIRVDIVHLNADFAEQGRSSDHDPIMVEMTFRSDR